MTQEQKERLRAWCDNLLVTYRLDYFRGCALRCVVRAIMRRCRGNFGAAFLALHEAKCLGFETGATYYTDLLIELHQIAKEVPLSDAAQTAIYHVFGGYWEYAIEALDKLRNEHNEQN